MKVLNSIFYLFTIQFQTDNMMHVAKLRNERATKEAPSSAFFAGKIFASIDSNQPAGLDSGVAGGAGFSVGCYGVGSGTSTGYSIGFSTGFSAGLAGSAAGCSFSNFANFVANLAFLFLSPSRSLCISCW